MIPRKTIVHYLLDSAVQRPKFEILKFKRHSHWEGVCYERYLSIVETLAHAFLSHGVSPGDRVALMSHTRVEWTYCDFAIMGIHGVTVPIYPSVTNEDLEFMINNSQSKVLILETKQHQKQWLEISARCPSVQMVLVLDKIEPLNTKEELSKASFFSWAEFLGQGRKHFEKHPGHFQSLAQDLNLSHTATLLYTSGTTGQPKGVVLTHLQVMSEIIDLAAALNLTDKDRSLAFLPFSHIMGRIENWGHVYANFQICYAESIDKIRSNLQEVSPTFILAVPRIFEKIYGSIWTRLQVNPFKKKLFDWALEQGRAVSQKKTNKEPIPPQLYFKFNVAKKLVFSEIKQSLGGQLRFAFSGGAPLSTEVLEFFHATDLLILEGYGLTETTGAISINRPFHYRFGTVGTPLENVELKLAEDGEVLVKSDKVMKEYYLNPEATTEAFDNGYFKTGDIGEWTSTHELRITDRKKDLIKTAGGKFVAPQKLENLIKLDSLVSQAHIHGDQKKYVVALLTLDPSETKKFAQLNHLSFKKTEDLFNHPKILEHLRRWVSKVNTSLASYESIKNFSILSKEFSIETGEITSSLKLKRRVIDEKYRDQIDKLYSS